MVPTVKTLAFTVVGEVLLSALAVNAPTDEEWDDYLGAWQRMRGGARRKVLVFAEKAGPTARQRDRLAEVLEGVPQNTAVVTPSAMGRLMVAAVAWANPAIRAFSPARVGEAFDFLGVPPEDRAAILDEARRLIAEVGAEISTGEPARPA
jgi:hypothetical protein